MRILQLTNKVPFPPIEGGSIAINMITQGLLKKGHYVKILSMNTSKHTVEMQLLPSDYIIQTGIEGVFVDNKIKPINALINLIFSHKSYHVTRFISKEFNQKLIEILKAENFDIVQLEMLYLTPYIETIRKFSKAKIILRAHNVEHFIWERIRVMCKNPFKKIYLKILVQRLKKFEKEQINHVDAIASISPKDTEYFLELGCKVPVTDIPVGFNFSKINETETASGFPGFFHLGSMNWIPNVEGIQWFIANVWLMFHEKYPQTRFSLAGRNFPDWFNVHSFEGIDIIGEVKDAGEFLNLNQIMIVPLFSGSGMRVKIIEGMAYGKTIISTTIGAEGILHENRKNIIIADSSEEFFNALIWCIENKKACIEIGRQAQKLIKNQYDNNIIIEKLELFYKKIINNVEN